jgi:ParB-like chromosome segregation protein Spo0J
MAKPVGLPDDVFETPPHPIAELFPMMADDELRALADDIRKNGLLDKIVVYEGQILDGRNRLKACKLAGVKPAFQSASVGRVTDQELLVYVLSCNLHRRHLTAEQKREVIAAVLKADPSRSNRRVAGETKADHKTVGSVREEMEGRGEIPHVAKRADAAGRQQPASKPSGRAAEQAASHAEHRARNADYDAKIAAVAAQAFDAQGLDPRESVEALQGANDKLREANDKLREANDKLKKANDRLRRFARAVENRIRLGLDITFARWHREMAKKYHPDRGGDNEIMADINDLTERLRAAFASGK